VPSQDYNEKTNSKSLSPSFDEGRVNQNLTLPDNSESKVKQHLTTLYYAKELYLKNGLSIIPLRPKSKEPAIDSWKPYQERRATEEEVEKWFRNTNNNIGIICGTISGNLVIIDFDSEELFQKWYEIIDKEYPEIRDIILNTWIIRTGRGRHIYLRVNEDEKEFKERFRNKPKLIDDVDIKGEGGYVVAPPSIHPNGKQYEFLISPNDTGITVVDSKTLSRILETIREIGEGEGKRGEDRVEKKEENRPKANRELTEVQIADIVDTLRKYYQKGYRDLIVHYLLGAFVKIGISYESAKRVVERLADITGDEEKEKRLYQVDWTYGKRVKEMDTDRFKGFSGLRDVIEKEVLNATRDIERAKDEALEVLNKLNEIIGIPIEQGIILVPLKIGSSIRQYYANDPDRGILILSRKGEEDKPDREYIFSYYIEKVVIYINPNDKNDVSYGVIFRHPKTKESLVYEERTIGEIVTDIVETKHGVRNINKIKNAISSLIDGFNVKGLAEEKSRIPATGFFEINGKLVFFEDPGFKVRLPEVSKEKTIEALKLLDEILAFWDYKDHVIANFYNDVQAPLGYIRKTYQRENKIVLNYGESHVGKTLRDKIYCMIWGLDESKTIIGSSNITAPQMAEYLNKTTFKIVFDEARNIFKYDGTADLIKNATTQAHVKDRIMPHLGYRVKRFISYASISMNLNYVEINVPGIETRIIPLKWTVADKKDPAKVEEFLKKIVNYRDKLAYIGAYLKDMFMRRWEEIREIIINNDNIEAGRKIFEMMYDELKLEKPKWLKEVKINYEIEKPSDEDVFFSFIREELQNAIARHRYILDIKGEEEYETRIDLLVEDWGKRLEWMARAGILPSFMALGKKSVYLFTSVIQEVRKKKGYEITGGLENLALRLGYKYVSYKGQRAMSVPIEDFVLRMTQIVEEDKVIEAM